jgi:hypothetical protein
MKYMHSNFVGNFLLYPILNTFSCFFSGKLESIELMDWRDFAGSQGIVDHVSGRV